MLAALILILCLFPACSQNPTPSPELPKAAIVDQLYSLQPNQAFIEQATQVLKAYGFKVDIYHGDEVTVDFYRRVPSYGYKLVIFRARSGLLGKEGEVIRRTCLFTSEPYSETKHVAEQLSDQLAKARINEYHPWVFAIGSEFITRSMEGQFPNTVIIMMGCSGLYLKDLAQAFVDKGASAYLAWDATVDLDYVDEATPYLMRQLCMDKVAIREAVTSTMNVVGPDPKHGAKLKYYPLQSGDKTVKELIQ